MTNINIKTKLEKVSMGHGCPRLLFLFHLQLNIGYTISEQDTIYILQTQYIATLFLSNVCNNMSLPKKKVEFYLVEPKND